MNDSGRTPIVISIFALLVAIVSAYAGYKNYTVSGANLGLNGKNFEETVNSSAIRDAYSIYFDLDRLELDNWQLSHLFAAPGRYQTVKTLIQQSLHGSPSRTAEFNLKERALASRIFDSYEETLFLLDRAQTSKDSERIKFLTLVVDYFDGRLLRNPRLLYYWPLLSSDYEESTRRHYEERVLHEPNHPPTVAPDERGPFAGGSK